MTNKMLEIIMKLRDEVSRRITTIRGTMKAAAESIRKHWLSVIAVMVALKQTFDTIKLGAQAQQQEEAFRNLTAAVGQSADEMIVQLRKASGETLSNAKIMEKASQAIILGLDPTKLTKLMEISRASARAFGTDVEFMFDSLVVGIGRQSKLMLDNLGIIVGADEAYRKYAAQLGKTKDQLTEAERKQAFLNAALKAGEGILEKVNVQQKTNLEHIQSLSAAWENARVVIGKGLLVLIQLAVLFWHTLVSGAATAQAKLGEFFSWFFEKLQVAAEFWGKVFHSEKMQDVAIKLEGMSDATADWAQDLQTVAMAQAEIAIEIENIMRASKELTDEQKEALATLHRARIEAQRQDLDKTRETFNAKEELARQSARNMQNAFADFFFKAFTGELRKLKDVFADFGRAVLQMISNILAKLVVIKLLTSIFKGGSIFGVDIGSLFHHGGQIRRAHQGMLANGEQPIIARTGEGIISRKGMQALGADGFHSLNRGDAISGRGTTIQPTIVIKAFDATDMLRHRKEIESMIVESIARNGAVRGAIKAHG